ncbi:TetR family transcriptional regulator [Paraburkholderia sp.]|uniref:TetR family transcriptional regulator n=1 Tax=Paraburkholderia sp. TaxID=1926495 RepID=UPI003C7EC110
MEFDTDDFSAGHETAQSRNRANRIAAILRTSKEALVEDGYAAFATRRVATRLGISLSNLQYYFSSREALLRATVEVELDRCLDVYRAIVARSASPQRRFQDLLECIIKQVNENEGARFVFEAWALAQHDDSVYAVVERVYIDYRGIFTRLLGQMYPLLTEEECHTRATVLTAQAEGMMIYAFRGGDTEKDYAEIVRTVKRSIRMVSSMPLSGGSDPAARQSSLGELANEQSTWLDLELPRPVVFGSEGHLAHARLEVVRPNNSADSSYNRPTMQSRRRAEKINDIVTAAANVFATEGYGNFTQARVAKLAGILPSGLQHYFPTHDELLRVTVNALLKTYLDRYTAMKQPNGKPAEARLSEIIDDVFAETCDPRAVRFSFEMFALAQHEEFVSDLFVRIYRTYRELMVELVSEIDPQATSREAYARASVIGGTLEGLMVYTQKTGRDTPGIVPVFRLAKSIALHIARGRSDPI